MGEARRALAQRQQALAAFAAVDADRIAAAVRKLCTAASGSFGADCYMHAAFAQHLFNLEGVPSEITIGYAAWRIGPGDGDVISHAPDSPSATVQRGNQLMFHAWLTLAGHIFDCTTYQLPAKAAALDRMDGGQTAVLWAPPLLSVPVKSAASLTEVRRAYEWRYYYAPDAAVARRVLATSSSLDPTAVAVVEKLYQTPTATVIGPNGIDNC